MEQIKSVTLEAINYFSEVLSLKTETLNQHEIQYKLIDFISSNGKNTFIELYNKTFSTKNFREVIELLKI
jgi:hypothetical protein